MHWIKVYFWKDNLKVKTKVHMKKAKDYLVIIRHGLELLLVISALLQVGPVQAQKVKGYGYLFCHMNRTGEYTSYALSRDGATFKTLLGGGPVYDASSLSRIEGGSRDAYIARAGSGKGYVMVVTDMSNHKSHTWNNYGIDLLKSDDLIHWSSVSIDFRKGPGVFMDAKSPDFYAQYEDICRVWAPQVIWDASYKWEDGSQGGYFIYYSLLNSKEDKYDRIFYSYADPSFTKLTKPQLLIDWGYATIDADLHYVAADNTYHVLIKKEGGKPGIYTATSAKLTGPYSLPDEDDYIDFEGNRKVEGPSAFQLIGDSTWRVAYVEYNSRPAKYKICDASATLQDFKNPRSIKGSVIDYAQHGSFMILTKKEYKRLEKWDNSFKKKQKQAKTH